MPVVGSTEEEAEESEEEGGEDVAVAALSRQEADQRACDLDWLARFAFAGELGYALAASGPRHCSSQSSLFGEFVFGFCPGNFYLVGLWLKI